MEEAHRLGKRVAAHAEGLEGSRQAIEEGVDTVEHGLSLHREPALLEKMAENGQTLVPTLSTFHDVSEDQAEKYPCALVGQAERQRGEAYETLAAAAFEVAATIPSMGVRPPSIILSSSRAFWPSG